MHPGCSYRTLSVCRRDPTFSKSLAKMGCEMMNPTPKDWGGKNTVAETGWQEYPAPMVPGGSILWAISRCCWDGAHLEDIVEPGEGWLLSEALFPGELWSLSPWLLQWLASSSNSCPDMILSISSSDIFDKELIHVRLGVQDSFCSFKTESLFQLHGIPKPSTKEKPRYPSRYPHTPGCSWI